jgi:hypothetical protein
MAGITVVRVGVEWEKYRVMSLKTCIIISHPKGYEAEKLEELGLGSSAYLQCVMKLFRNSPLFITQFVLPQAHCLVPCYVIDGHPIL